MSEPTRDELIQKIADLEKELDHYINLYRETHLEAVRVTSERNKLTEKVSPLTFKQTILHQLVLSAHGAFPHMFSAESRWERAEQLYNEGVKRGHYPKDSE